MNRLARISATVASSLALVAGFTTMASAHSVMIDHTGEDSTNTVELERKVETNVSNDNYVKVKNSNGQLATSGSATALLASDVDDVTSGDASNENSTGLDVSIDNSWSGGAGAASAMDWSWGDGDYTISHTGEDSYNSIEVEQKVETNISNNNEVKVYNYNEQYAASGDATVFLVEEADDVESGAASNENSTEISVHVAN